MRKDVIRVLCPWSLLRRSRAKQSSFLGEPQRAACGAEDSNCRNEFKETLRNFESISDSAIVLKEASGEVERSKARRAQRETHEEQSSIAEYPHSCLGIGAGAGAGIGAGMWESHGFLGGKGTGVSSLCRDLVV